MVKHIAADRTAPEAAAEKWVEADRGKAEAWIKQRRGQGVERRALLCPSPCAACVPVRFPEVSEPLTPICEEGTLSCAT